MRKIFVHLLATALCLAMSAAAAKAASGPKTGWSTITLPNPQVTPDWRTYAPADCDTGTSPNTPEDCANDHRFWEEWDFANFAPAIDASFQAIAAQGKYQAAMVLMPLDDVGSLSAPTTYGKNISLMYQSAAKYGVQFQTVLFPKWKYGAEWCYLYGSSAPSSCPTAPGTTTAIAYQQLTKLMNYLQALGGACSSGRYNSSFAIWYGWSDFSPGFGALKSFWQSLPNSGCNLRASYMTWLDTAYTGNSDVQQMQRYVVKKLHQAYWVDTELYSTAQMQTYKGTYAPYQTIITGVWGEADTSSWATDMCAKWGTAGNPQRLGAWTFYDRDVSPYEEYRAYINGSMAAVGAICP